MTASETVATALQAAAADRGRVLLRSLDHNTLTYHETLAQSGRYAHVLRSLGVRPGDRVAVQVDKSFEALLLYLATLRAGAVYLPLNTAYTLAELEYFIADAQPAVLVGTPNAHTELAVVAQRLGVPHCLTLAADGGGSLPRSARAESENFEDVACGADDLAAILYTSGTTGRSKGAMLTHGNLWSNAAALRDSWRFSSADVLLHALPIFHIHGLFVAVNVAIAAGASLLWLPRFEPGAVLQGLREASVMMGVPTHYVRLLNAPELDSGQWRRMRLFVSGSAPLLPETHRAWRERTGHTLLERYGMSETGINTSNPYDGERRPGSVGKPLPGVELRITEPANGTPLPHGAIGMIEVRGPNVFRGYWRQPEKTRSDFRADGFFVTGDIGMIDADGYVSIVGRAKDLVISGGYNVYPKEIELELDALPGVRESAVFGAPHADFGEAVTAVVVAAGDAVPSEAAMLATLRTRLASYKLPKRVLIVPELPRNTMGKVQKGELRARYADLYQKPR